jgi:DNA polymerase III subunit beta
MKEESKIVRLVKVPGRDLVPSLNVVEVIDGVGTVFGIESMLKFNTDLSDGKYHKDLLGKSLLKTTDIEVEETVPSLELGKECNLSKETVREIIKAFAFCGNDDLRPVMSGVFLNRNNVCGTNAHKLYSNSNINVDINEDIILPVSILPFLKYIKEDCTLSLSKCKRWVKLSSGNVSLTTLLIEGKFPNYKAVIPSEHNHTFNVDKKELINAVKNSLTCANKSTKMVAFTFSEGKLNLKSEDLDYGLSHEEDISSDSCVDFRIGFNGKFMLEVLSIIDKDINNVKFELTLSSRCVLINENSLLMPLMINN